MTKMALALFVVGIVAVSETHPRPVGQLEVLEFNSKPNPNTTRFLERWPTAADLARLERAKGRTRLGVVQILGPPSLIERKPGGLEIWNYPWCACCQVSFKNGVAVDTFYTSGY